jgi:hypothetical protein
MTSLPFAVARIGKDSIDESLVGVDTRVAGEPLHFLRGWWNT